MWARPNSAPLQIVFQNSAQCVKAGQLSLNVGVKATRGLSLADAHCHHGATRLQLRSRRGWNVQVPVERYDRPTSKCDTRETQGCLWRGGRAEWAWEMSRYAASHFSRRLLAQCGPPGSRQQRGSSSIVGGIIESIKLLSSNKHHRRCRLLQLCVSNDSSFKLVPTYRGDQKLEVGHETWLFILWRSIATELAVWKRVPLIARNLQTQAKQSGFAVAAAAAAGSKALAAKADKQRGQTPHAPSSAQSEKEKENKLKYFFLCFHRQNCSSAAARLSALAVDGHISVVVAAAWQSGE